MTEAIGQGSTEHVGNTLVEEHRALAAATAHVVEARDLEDLLRRLGELRTLLKPHFVSEEEPGGFFDTVRTAASRHIGVVAELGKEHGKLLADLDAVAEQARMCLAGPVAEVCRRAADLSRRLREHEARENELLFDAFYIDIGEEE